jgi:hypothetical protein
MQAVRPASECSTLRERWCRRPSADPIEGARCRASTVRLQATSHHAGNGHRKARQFGRANRDRPSPRRRPQTSRSPARRTIAKPPTRSRVTPRTPRSRPCVSRRSLPDMDQTRRRAAREWAYEEVGHAELGDTRRTARLVRMLATIAEPASAWQHRRVGAAHIEHRSRRGEIARNHGERDRAGCARHRADLDTVF